MRRYLFPDAEGYLTHFRIAGNCNLTIMRNNPAFSSAGTLM